MPRLLIPDPSLVLLIGPSGAGKSTFARRNFLTTEVISSDHCRAMVIDDEADQRVSGAAFSILRHIVRARLRHLRLTVIDATNIDHRARIPFLRMAQVAGLPVVAITFELSLASLLANNLGRGSRLVPTETIAQQFSAFEATRERLEGEGYALVHRLDETTKLAAKIERRPAQADQLPGR